MCDALVLWSMAKAMDFNHLPEAGGIYDQDPELLKQWTVIWGVEADVRRKEQDKRGNKGSRGSMGGRQLKKSTI